MPDRFRDVTWKQRWVVTAATLGLTGGLSAVCDASEESTRPPEFPGKGKSSAPSCLRGCRRCCAVG